MDKLEDLDTGIVNSLDQSCLLAIREIGWDSNDGRVDILSCIIRSRCYQPADLSSCDLRYGNGRRGVTLFILNGEGDCGLVFNGVR